MSNTRLIRAEGVMPRRKLTNNRRGPSHPRATSKAFVLGAIGSMLICVLSVGFAEQVFAADADRGGIVSDGKAVQQIVVTVNKSRTFNVERPYARAIVGSVDVADVMPLSDRSIYIQGKKVGTTNVSLFDGNARLIGVLDLEVALDTLDLQRQLRAGTGNQNIRVSSLRGQVVVGGLVVDAPAADRAMQVAKGIAGDSVVNAIQIAPAQQVMLEVRFLEVSRDGGRELGVEWFGANRSGTGGGRSGRGIVGAAPVTPSTPSGVPIFQTLGTIPGGSLGGPFGTLIARALTTNNAAIDVLVTALEEKGLIRRLAEPNLIALSGDRASFLAGGEFPVPISSTGTGGFPVVTIQFKKFGVKLDFKPTVLSRGVINLLIQPEVSELDFTNAVQVNGTVIPALNTRNASTTVELRDGQSFAIAGLLSSQNAGQIAQLPWIGSVPVLGALFRSSSYQQKETDLVIVVTPRLVAPAVPGQRLASPLESRLPANDVDFFLNGQPEVKKRYQEYIVTGGELKGPYGHMIQVEQGVTTPVRKK